VAVICPSILAADSDQYHHQMERIGRFAERIQIDLTDGQFAEPKTISPEEAWWPVGVKADFHLMYKQPGAAAEIILHHEPHMIIVHSEADGNFLDYAGLWRSLGVKAGIALLPQTDAVVLLPALDHLDHVLIFSGKLGQYGGSADLELLKKVDYLKRQKPELEVGWDGGVNNQNISELVLGGVDVLDVGGFIQEADDPTDAYRSLERIAAETGTT